MHLPESVGERGPSATPPLTPRGPWAAPVVNLHRLLCRLGFYPAALCTALAVAMLAARWGKTGYPSYGFLIWNLFLAWLPWLFGVPFAVSRSPKGLLPAFVLWLVFLPNAPYLATDLLHLRPAATIPIWYDAALLFVFAWTGCLLGFLSLAAVHGRVERWIGRAGGWAFVAVVCVLCGYGIYLGRFLRWNSWDVVTRPMAVLSDVADHVLQPSQHPRTLLVTALFAAFLAAGYGSFAGRRRAPARAARQ